MKPHTQAVPSYHFGPNMTPLVDVVMVILIFLMLAGSFGSAEHFLASTLPIQGCNVEEKLDTVTPPPVVIDVNIYANGDATVSGTPGRFQDPADVRGALADRMATLISNGKSPSDVQAVLHPVLGTQWAALAPLYDAAVLAEYKNVSFAVAR